MRTTTTAFDTEAARTGSKPVWLLEIDHAGSTYYYSDRAITVSGQAYQARVTDWSEISMMTERLSGGGIINASSISMSEMHNGQLDPVSPKLQPGNVVRIYLWFEAFGGTPALSSADKLLLLDGIIADPIQITLTDCTFAVLGSEEIKTGTVGELVTTDEFPYCDPDEVGIVKPIIYGRVWHSRCIAVDAGFTTTLAADINASDTTLSFSDSFYATGVQIDNERIDFAIGAGAGDQQTGCIRGTEGTTAVAHDKGSKVFVAQEYYTYLIADHPIKSIGASIADNSGLEVTTEVDHNLVSGDVVSIWDTAGVYINCSGTVTVTASNKFKFDGSDLYLPYISDSSTIRVIDHVYNHISVDDVLQKGNDYWFFCDDKAYVIFKTKPLFQKSVEINVEVEDDIGVDDATGVDDTINVSSDPITTTETTNYDGGTSVTDTYTNGDIVTSTVDFGASSATGETSYSVSIYTANVLRIAARWWDGTTGGPWFYLLGTSSLDGPFTNYDTHSITLTSSTPKRYIQFTCYMETGAGYIQLRPAQRNAQGLSVPVDTTKAGTVAKTGETTKTTASRAPGSTLFNVMQSGNSVAETVIGSKVTFWGTGYDLSSPNEVINHLLLNYGDNIDASDIDASISTSTSIRPSVTLGFFIDEQKDLMTLCRKIAWQSACRFFWDAGLARMVTIKEPSSPVVINLFQRDVVLNSIKMERTRVADLCNTATTQYGYSWYQQPNVPKLISSLTRTNTDSISTFGEKRHDDWFEFDLIVAENLGSAGGVAAEFVTNFYVQTYLPQVTRIFEFTAPIGRAKIMRGDVISLTYTIDGGCFARKLEVLETHLQPGSGRDRRPDTMRIVGLSISDGIPVACQPGYLEFTNNSTINTAIITDDTVNTSDLTVTGTLTISGDCVTYAIITED